jgi:hypothetical protein
MTWGWDSNRVVGPGDLITDDKGRVGVIVARYRAYHDHSDEYDWRWIVVFPDQVVDTESMAGCSLAVRA